MKMDVIPGRVNHYEITPTTIGDYKGKCYELCGVYHSRMLFNVKVVSSADYEQYLQDLEDAGHESEEPAARRRPTPTPRPDSSPAKSPTEARSDRHSCTADDRQPVASRSASRSSGS